LFKTSPINDEDILRTLSLYTSRIDLADMLFMVELYKKQIEVHGVKTDYNHLETQRTQLYGNICFKESPVTTRLEWEALNLICISQSKSETSGLENLKSTASRMIPRKIRNAFKKEV
jgi:hypothetical protein